MTSAIVRDFRAEIGWQQARDQHVFGVRQNPDTLEWEVVRYRLEIKDEGTG